MRAIACSEHADVKTKVTNLNVSGFLMEIEDKQRREDCKTIARLVPNSTGNVAKICGRSMVGFGSYDYKYASGREGSWFLCGFSLWAQSLTIYIMPGFGELESLMQKLGKHKTGKSCLYIKKLEDVDLTILERLIYDSVNRMRSKYS